MTYKILVVGMNGDPATTGYATRVLTMLHTLKNMGHEVIFLRFYPAFKAVESWRSSVGKIGVTLHEIPIPPYARFALLRGIAFLYTNIVVHLTAKFRGIHCIQVETNDSAYAALWMKWTKTPVIVDFHGAVAEEETFFSGSAPLKNSHWKNYAEKLALTKAAACFVVAQAMVEHLTKKHQLPASQKCVIVPVNVDEIFFKPTNRNATRAGMAVNNDEILLTYCGGAQAYQCLNEMHALFALLAPLLPVKLLIISRDLEHFAQRFAEFGNRIIYRAAAHHEVPGLLAAGDVGLLLRTQELLNFVSCPTKAGEYLACGLPLITTAWAGHAPLLVKRFDVGLIVDPEKFDIASLLHFMQHKPDPTHCSAVARQHLHWNSSAMMMRNTYNRLLIPNQNP